MRCAVKGSEWTAEKKRGNLTALVINCPEVVPAAGFPELSEDGSEGKNTRPSAESNPPMTANCLCCAGKRR